MDRINLIVYVWIFASFIVGYYSNKFAHLYGGVKVAVNLVKASQILAIFVLMKTIENAYYGKNLIIMSMKQNNLPEETINKFSSDFEQELLAYGDKSVKLIASKMTGSFKNLVLYRDWKTAVKYASENKKELNDFIKELK